MKWIKKRDKFLAEAKIRDVIYPIQAKAVSEVWGEKFLDYEEITPSDKIVQGKWKLSEEDKNKVLGTFFGAEVQRVMNIFNKLPDKFSEVLSASVNIDLISSEKHKIIVKGIDIKKPSIDQIVIIFDPIFRKLSPSETKSSEMIQRDENGKAVKDSDGNVIKVSKKEGDLVFANNLVNINTFISGYNACFPDNKVGEDTFKSTYIMRLKDATSLNENPKYNIDFKIYDKDVYLKIVHNPKDILNMSISKFYASCQHLYDGGYRRQLLSNVFDPNSIPAFLVFDTPIYWDKNIISDQLPISRMMIRSIETYDNKEKKIFFDRAYPDRMKDVFDNIIEKYTENKQTVNDSETYYFTPDVELEDTSTVLPDPYMDRLRIKREVYIGKNIKTLYLSRLYDWGKIKIDPNARIKELIIETTEIPDDLSKIPLTPDWIKFRYLTINDLSIFSKIKTDSIAFDKCKLDTSILNEKNDIKKLQIISCDLTGDLDFSKFENLDELHIVYTLNSLENLITLTKDLKVNKIVISGDLIKGKEGRNYITELKKRKIKVEIVGPII